MINVGIIGYGYWGPNLTRNFVENENTTLKAVCDLDASKLKKINNTYPSLEITTDVNDLILNKNIDAIAIATPVESHFELANFALQSGKHVLLSKPIASNSNQANELIKESNKRNLVLMIDHTFIFSGPIRTIKSLLNDNALGNLLYYDSIRVNLGIFQNDVNVLWDLAVHDLSILSYLFKTKPKALSAVGHNHISSEPENIAFLTLFYEDNFIANINVNWLSPVKIRRTLIGGTKKMVVYDDLEISEKIKIYDSGIDVKKDSAEINKLLINYRTGDLFSPKIDPTEALKSEIEHFVECINNNQKPISDGEQGLEIIKILEAASISVSKKGEPVEIK